MNDISTLQIRVLSSQVADATSRLHALEKGAKQAETATGGVTKASMGMVKGLMAAAAGAGALGIAIGGLRSIVKTTAEFQALEGQLRTATGSIDNAKNAFQAIKDFASTTPYDLQQATKAFTTLVNMGLTPSERALRSYGNTASAMGKPLIQMVEAVADAAVGEFMRLREFGIKSKVEGDKVAFTFQGVTTTVKNNAAEIEEYLMKLGETKFGNAMELQMETLNGAFSNLGDSWEILKNTMGSGGLGDGVENAVRTATSALEGFNAYLASGEFEANMATWGVAFEGFTSAWEEGIDGIFNTLTTKSQAAYDGFYSDSQSVWDDVIAYVQSVPAAFVALVEEITIRLWGIVDAIAAVGSAAYAQFQADMNALISLAKAAGTAIADALKGHGALAVEGLKANARMAMQTNITATAGIQAAYNTRMANNAENTAHGVAAAWDKAAASMEAQADARQAARDKRTKYESDAAARATDKADRLAQYKAGTGGGSPSPKGGGGGGGGGGVSEFDQLQKQLMKEEGAIEDSYLRRLDLIKANTAAGSQVQTDLSLALVDQYEEQAQKEIDRNKRSVETMWEAFQQEEALITATYEKRKEIILALTEATEAEKQDMLDKAHKEYLTQVRENNKQTNDAYLGAAEDFFGNIASIGSAFGKKGFKIAQAAAVAQATIKMYESATSAYASLAGIPYVGPALGAAAAAGAIAAGAANIAQIKSQQYSGAYAHGGMIPSGKYGLVGEAGPELISGPAVVTSAAATRDRMNNTGGSGGNTIINIKNYTGEPIQTKETKEGENKMIEFIVGQAEKRIAANVRKGGTPLARALEGTYKVGRGGR